MLRSGVLNLRLIYKKTSGKAELTRLENLLIKIEKGTEIPGKCGTDVLRNYLDIYFEENVVKNLM